MKRFVLPAFGAAAALLLQPLALPADAQPDAPSTATTSDGSDQKADPHDRFDPRHTALTTQRQNAVDELVTGKADLVGKGPERVIAMADGTEVSYPVNQHAKMLTFLVEFGDQVDGRYTALPTGPGRAEIPEPDPEDNSTYWRADFDREHYLDLFFDGLADQRGESMRHFYQQASSGRFDLSGDVSDWVTVPMHQASYGVTENQTDMTRFIDDSAEAWYDAQASAGQTPAEIADRLRQYDVWDRYDHDGDGDYDEPDGYIDHFQAVHAGVGEEAGGPSSAIWSHRWAANQSGVDGPPGAKFGGVEIGDTGIWIRDYTTEPENGGLGVFAHEFGHDLGLDDYYATNGAQVNGVGYWSAMALGSWLGHGDGTIGSSTGGFGATEKLYLGWYGRDNRDLAVVDGLAATPQDVVLGPAHRATTVGKQAVLVNVPDGIQTLPGPSTSSTDGAYLWSGRLNSTSVTATSDLLTVPAGAPTLTARLEHQIETDYDYAYLQVRPDTEATWTNVETSRSTATDPNHLNLGAGITGSSTGYVSLTADLSAWAGRMVNLRWAYVTDESTTGTGLSIDSMTVGDTEATFTDLAADGWSVAGFHAVSNNAYEIRHPRYYLAENRQYVGYDEALATGPYDFLGANTVKHYSYQDGLLVWFANSRYSDNNQSLQQGNGANLPIDAQSTVQRFLRSDGTPGSSSHGTRQAYDATFDIDETDALQLTLATATPGVTQTLDLPARPSVPVFEDSSATAYTDLTAPADSQRFHARTAGSGAQIQVISSDETTGRMVLKVGRLFVAATSGAQLSGSAAIGEQLSATAPTWFQPEVGTTIEWLRDGHPIPGADSTTYDVLRADVDRDLSVRFTGTKAGYRSSVVESVALAVARNPAPSPTSAPTITGVAQVGGTLTATAGTWPVDGASTFVWSVDGTEVATGPTLRLRRALAGKQIRLTETFTGEETAPAFATVDSTAVARSVPTVTISKAKLRAKRKGTIVLKVQVAGEAATGKLQAVWSGPGKKVRRTVTVKGSKATLKIPTRPKGRYRLVVSYLGDTAALPRKVVLKLRVR